jgi:hypothetical protein
VNRCENLGRGAPIEIPSSVQNCLSGPVPLHPSSFRFPVAVYERFWLNE